MYIDILLSYRFCLSWLRCDAVDFHTHRLHHKVALSPFKQHVAFGTSLPHNKLNLFRLTGQCLTCSRFHETRYVLSWKATSPEVVVVERDCFPADILFDFQATTLQHFLTSQTIYI
jgi:hypothetical protein